MEGLLHVQQFHGLALGELLNGNTGPGSNDVGDVLLIDHGGRLGSLRNLTFRGGLRIRAGFDTVVLKQGADLFAQFHFLFAQLSGLGEVLIANGFLLLFLDGTQFLVDFLRFRRKLRIEQSHP